MGDREDHNHCTHKFVELANELKNEGHDTKLVSAALMTASGVFATFAAAGNQGVLEPSGVDKVVNLFRNNLEFIQARKKEEIQKELDTQKAEPDTEH
ncbi:MAG: DUF3144 domain-containing protein [Xanthomonadales bacterium]|nr:DUF3144 domain-containing protein [Xanthomonadales bacterium]NNL94739.1 DUF3144 domain-containing protein [Xanthomonadales bacterium]